MIAGSENDLGDDVYKNRLIDIVNVLLLSGRLPINGNCGKLNLTDLQDGIQQREHLSQLGEDIAE